MGQKVHPYGFRLGINKPWLSKWYVGNNKDYIKFLHEDLKIRSYVEKNYKHASVSKVVIERASNKVKVVIYTSRPGVVIGKKGSGLNQLEKELKKIVTDKDIIVNVVDVKRPDLDAQIVARNIAHQIEKRVSYRRAMKRALYNAMKFGAKGVKIRVSGRLAGAEIARSEWYVQGSVPLNTIRADIDYGFAEAFTTYGVIGVKVWIYKGDIFESKEEEEKLEVIENA